MKLNFKILTAIVIASFLVAGATGMRAQGYYSDDKDKTATVSNQNNDSGGGGIFRAPPDEDDPGTDRPDPGEGDNPDPIGGGILILNLLAGGYILLKRNLKRKHEE